MRHGPRSSSRRCVSPRWIEVTQRESFNNGGQRGFILLAVLMALVAATGLSATLIYYARIEARAAASVRDGAIAAAAAEGAIRMAVFRLLSTPPAAADQGEFPLIAAGATGVVRHADLSGRINPNIASPALLFQVFIALGADEATARGAAATVVRGRGVNAGSGPLTPFRDLDDLSRRAGLPPAMMALLEPHMTTWWRGRPDPKRASKAVRDALILANEDDLAAATQPDERAVLIEAIVSTPSHKIAIRAAVARLGLSDDGLSVHFLAWDPPGPRPWPSP